MKLHLPTLAMLFPPAQREVRPALRRALLLLLALWLVSLATAPLWQRVLLAPLP